MIDWQISIGAVLIVLLSVWLGHRLSTNRAELQTYRQKVFEFKEMFVPFLKELESAEANPGVLASQFFPIQDEAARRLAIYMGTKKRRRFLQRWELYAAHYREKKAKGVLSQLATEVDDIGKASPGAPGAIEYILEQTAKRRDQVRRLVLDALNIL